MKMMASVPGHTVEELIHHWSLLHPDTEAFVSHSPGSGERRSLSRRDVHELSRKFAAKLRLFGVSKGDVVCVSLANCLERVVADFGTICSGAVALNGQVLRADGEDLLQALNSSKAKAIVLDPTSSTGAWAILKRYIKDTDCDVRCDTLPYLKRVISCRRDDANPDLDFFSGLRDFNKSLQRAHALTSDVAVIWTTSGSTGFSKLVPQTHGNLTHICLQVLHISGLKGGSKFLNCAPLGWAGGFPLWFLASGATRVFVDTTSGPPRDMAGALWECIQKEKCIFVFTSPMYVNAILERPELWQDGNKDGMLWKPSGINIAGQPMKRCVVRAAGKLCEHIDINYGTTECGVIATTRVTDPELYQDGMTGRAAPGTEIRIVDDDLKDVALGETGEILARNPALLGRYIDNEDATNKAFTTDGWFKTDDVGYFLPDRQLVHLGRRSDAITRGAYLVYPGWLETLLRHAPEVKDVCVVPVPDPVLHHEICACVVPPIYPPSPGWEDSLRSFSSAQMLTQPEKSMQLTPRYYVAIEALPLTPNGKISRRDVAQLAVRELGLQQQ